MSNDEIQYSDDGQWWWDGEDWQPVDGTEGGEAEGGEGEGDGGDEPVEEGEPAFDFDTHGLVVDAMNSPVPSEGEPLKIAFTVVNTGTAAGSCHVMLRIDEQETDIYWDSHELAPGGWETPDGDGYVHDVPAQTEGRHLFEVFADPPGEFGGYTSNEIQVGSPED